MAQANFFQPGFDEQTETQNIERQRQYAQLLRQKATEQSPQGSMVGGHYVAPSFTEGLAQLLNAYQGGQGVRQADERQKALAEAVRGRQTEEIGQFSKLLGGEAARDIQPLTQNDDEGNAMPVARKAAVPGDINAAYQYAASAKTPGLQQAGMQGQLQMAQEQAKLAQKQAEQTRMMAVLQSAPGPQQAIAAGVPPEMVKQFYESKNYGRDKVNFQKAGGSLVPTTEYGDTPVGVAPIAMTVTPDAVLTDTRVRSEGALNRGVTVRGQNLVDGRAAVVASEGGTNQAVLNKQNGKPPAGFRWKADGGLEAIPGGPADQKAQNTEAGKGTVDSVVATLRNSYDSLNKGGGITSTQEGAISNLGRRASQSGAGQFVGGAVGSVNQKERDAIAQTRPLLLQAIMKATGMSAKQMDSNAELKLYLATATDPTLSLQANREALDRIEQLYGSGSGKGAPTNPPATAAPTAAPSVRGGPMQKPVKPASVSNW